MDMQSQMTRPDGHDQAEDPIRIHHPEEEEHQEKGASKVLKKVKAKAKKIKNSLTKHGHGHEHDHDVEEEEDEYDEQDPEVHGAPVYESSAVRGGVTGQPLSHPGEAKVAAPEEIIPPGTKVFPVVSSDYTRPVDPAGTGGGGSDYLSGVSNYQSKVTDPTKEVGSGEAGIVESLGRLEVTDDESYERELPTRSHEFGLKDESGIGKDSPAGFGGEAGAGLGKDFLTRSHEFDHKTETGVSKNSPTTGTHDQEAKPSTYTEKIASATSVIADKAIAAKNAVASKLGYSGDTTGAGGGGQQESFVGEETPRSATGYGQKVAGTVAGTLTPVYEKVKETGSNVMTKLPLSGGGRGAETQQGEDKGVSARDYLAEKLRPGEEDKALSEVIAEKLHLGGGGEKKTTMTKEMEVTVEKIPSDQILEEREHGEVIAEEGKGGGMVGKLKGAVTSWLGGTKEEELKPKSSGSVGGEESSQSLGSTVGTKGFSDSGGAVSTQRGLQESGN